MYLYSLSCLPSPRHYSLTLFPITLIIILALESSPPRSLTILTIMFVLILSLTLLAFALTIMVLLAFSRILLYRYLHSPSSFVPSHQLTFFVITHTIVSGWPSLSLCLWLNSPPYMFVLVLSPTRFVCDYTHHYTCVHYQGVIAWGDRCFVCGEIGRDKNKCVHTTDVWYI